MATPSTFPSDGRITSLQNYSAALVGTELLQLVAPGNAAAGVNYNVTVTQMLSGLLPALPPQSANVVLAGPTSGAATATPTFRNLVLADIPGGTSGFPLVGNNATSAPSYQALNLAGAGVTGVLTVPNGGIGTATLPAFGVALGNTTGPLSAAIPSTAGFALISNNATSAPSFQAINLASSLLTGVLQPVNGGTGYTTGTRQLLVANATYFVATTGSDSNSGLSSTTAWLTPQHAANFIMNTLDLGGFNVTVNVGTGTYTANLALGPYVGRATEGHTGPVIFVGNPNNPSSVIFDASAGANTITAVETGGLEWDFNGFQLQNSQTAACVVADAGGWITLSKIVFGAASGGQHVEAEDGGIVEFTSNYTVSGGAALHLYCLTRGMILYSGAVSTVTLSGSPAFSSFFADVDSNALISAPSVAFSGTATGTRYFQQNGGSFLLVSGGSYVDPNTVFPGNANGFPYGSKGFEVPPGAIGALPFALSTNPIWTSLPAVAVGQTLVSNGVATNPIYTTAPSLGGKINLLNATPLSATATAAMLISNVATFGVFCGTGVPAIAAATGSLYLRNDGSTATTRMYVNQNGSTTWTAVTTQA